MLNAVETLTQGQTESSELVRSASRVAEKTHQATTEIAAWCTRDSVRQNEKEEDSVTYVIESIRFVMRIGNDALARKESFDKLASSAEKARQLVLDGVGELKEFGLLEPDHFYTLRELDYSLLQMATWADTETEIYEQCVESLEELYARYQSVCPTRRTNYSSTMPMLAS